MKRKEIVSSLIKEGFTEKTLASMSDKELRLMANRILKEQISDETVTNVSKNDIETVNALKQQKKPFATYEGEMTEEGTGEVDRSDVINKINYKIEHETDENKIENLKELLRRMGETVEDVAPAFEAPTVGLNEWVNDMVGKNVHPFTSKTEIMGLIKNKLHEQEAEVAEPEVETGTELPDFLSYESINGGGEAPAPAEPITKPTTRPGNPDKAPKRKNPLHPGPGINPAPKAEKR